MAKAGAHKRSTFKRRQTAALSTLAVALVLAGLAVAAPHHASASGAGVGGTAAPTGESSPSGPTTGATGPISTATNTTGSSTQGTAGKKTTSGKAPKKNPRRPAGVTISSAACVPASHCSDNPREVSLGGELLVRGPALGRGMVVAFPRRIGARIARSSPRARLSNSKLGLVVRVPANAHSGRIMVLLSGGRHSNSYGPIKLVRHALHPPAPPAPSQPPATTATGTAFDGQGMWIWYVNKSDGGNLASIVARAHAAGVSTLFIKSSDGSSNYWSQFSPELVAQLHANGLKACAWQYVYGSNPLGEAKLGAQAVAAGADCLVIDAEAEYEKRYGAAQQYIAALRAKIGTSYPLGLASFPYVYYHTALPYSVFLAPNGAQYNLPQMYWKAIGNSVDTVYANTFISNRIYGRPVFPLGQTYESPSAKDLLRFREEAPLYGASGISWWDYQETSTPGWAALAAPLEPLSGVTPNPAYSELYEGKKGDPVLWMQEHLASAIPSQAVTGIFDAATKTDLEQFQSTHGLTVSGHTEAATWQALLALPPVAVDWTGAGPKG